MLEDKVAGQTESMLQIFNKLHLAVHAWSISIHLLNSQVHWTLTLIHTHEVLDVQVLTWNQVIAWVCVFQIVIVCHITQELAELGILNANWLSAQELIQVRVQELLYKYHKLALDTVAALQLAKWTQLVHDKAVW